MPLIGWRINIHKFVYNKYKGKIPNLLFISLQMNHNINIH